MTEKLRAVLDTNIFVSATLSRNVTSPTRELLQRWQNDEFILLMCEAQAEEIVEKLLQHNIAVEKVIDFIALLRIGATWITLTDEDILPIIVADPDDDIILACAVQGQADYLATYDPHFDDLGTIYQGIKIVKALPFLWAIRGDELPINHPTVD